MDKNPHSERRRQFRELLRAIRKEQGLRQTEVAEALDEPQSLVSKYESGERRLDVIELQEICDALGVTLSEFVDRLGRVQAKRRRSKR